MISATYITSSNSSFCNERKTSQSDKLLFSYFYYILFHKFFQAFFSPFRKRGEINQHDNKRKNLPIVLQWGLLWLGAVI